jgi:diacylglycerol kinase
MPGKRLNSFRYAFAGLAELLRSQANARIHAGFTVIVVAAGFYFNLTPVEWCLIVFAIASVFSAEAFNTALENLTDLVSPEYHPLAGKAKDVAAAAVLLTAIGAAIVGFIIFLPKVLNLFGLP